ncbi:hypothetical protein [Leptolyngbya ohadii]|uniref:hypothetical protein n=1 Tax=Leptolyngbya ohadii TaxID=1962290 RepID=UPI0015C65E54|nr:hypothetical protein [Leptolyngbya ohadii]
MQNQRTLVHLVQYKVWMGNEMQLSNVLKQQQGSLVWRYGALNAELHTLPAICLVFVD